MSAPLVVIDTDVVITALLGSEGASSAKVLRAAGTGEVRTALSHDSLRELVMVVRRRDPLIPRASKALEAGLDLWQHGTFYQTVWLDWPTVADRKDHWILDLAWASTADYIVAWEPRLTGARMPFPVEVKTPPELLELLRRMG